MNWDAISAISETIASVAVVLSLIYLAMQIKHSNKLSQSQTRTELRHMATAEVHMIMDNPELQLNYYKEDLTEEEKVSLHYHLTSAMRFREFIWRQHQLALLDDNTFQNYMKIVPMLVGSERTNRWWNTFKGTSYDPAYITFIDDLLERSQTVDVRDILKVL